MSIKPHRLTDWLITLTWIASLILFAFLAHSCPYNGV